MMRAKVVMRSATAANLAARLGALTSLGVATWLIARIGGPAPVGDYALLRLLTSLVGVLLSGGLPAAVAYFLAGPLKSDRRLRPTIAAMAITSGLVGSLCWTAGIPLLHYVFFRDLSTALLMVAAPMTLSRVCVATAKGAAQGAHDLPGSNLIIVLEELTFLPVFGCVLLLHLRGIEAIVTAMLCADYLTVTIAWGRHLARGFFTGAQPPSLELARRIYTFGLRGEVGAIISLLNLRLDFAVLGAMAGPAALGGYAVASKYAELLRLPPAAIQWVLYPRYARAGATRSAEMARAILPRAGMLTALLAVPLGVGAGILLPFIYGDAFRSAVVPAQIIVVGLSIQGVAGVLTAYLYGNGHPGLNSLALGGGLVLTVALDVALIPTYGSVGAAIASTLAYLTSTGALLGCFWWMLRAGTPADAAASELQSA